MKPEAPVEIVQAVTPADWRVARALVEEYAAGLGVDLCFQNFAHEMDHIAEAYSPPAGAMLLAREGDAAIGCVGLRPFGDAGDCEMKRMYVAPAGRGRGTGRRLAEAVIAAARAAGYSRMLLDTLPHLKAARELYATLGFRPIPEYRHNPVPGTVFLALDLR